MKSIENHNFEFILILEFVYNLFLESKVINIKSQIICFGILKKFYQISSNFKNNLVKIDENNEEKFNFCKNEADLILFIKKIFYFVLNQITKKQNISLSDYSIIIKYFSFIYKFSDNKINSYYDIKEILLKINKSINKPLKFKIISKLISENISSQFNLDFKIDNKIKSDDFNKNDINYCFKFEKFDSLNLKFNYKALKLISEKIKFWENLSIENYKKLEIFKNNCLKLSKEIKKMKIWFERNIMNMKNEEGLFLRLKCKYYYFVIEDKEKANIFVKKYEFFIRNEERYINSSKFMSTLNIFEGQCINLSISILDEKGKIFVRDNRKIANFFEIKKGNEKKELKITDFMTKSISNNHKFFIKRFLQNGDCNKIKEILHAFVKNGKNFIFKVKIFRFFMFQNDCDFIVSSTILKIKDEIFMICFDNNGNIEGISQELAQIINLQSKDLNLLYNKCTIQMLIPSFFSEGNIFFPFDKDKLKCFNEVFELGISETKYFYFPANLDLFIQRYNYNIKSKKTFNSNTNNVQLTKSVILNSENALHKTFSSKIGSITNEEINNPLIINFIEKFRKKFEIKRYKISFRLNAQLHYISEEEFIVNYCLLINEIKMNKKYPQKKQSLGKLTIIPKSNKNSKNGNNFNENIYSKNIDSSDGEIKSENKTKSENLIQQNKINISGPYQEKCVLEKNKGKFEIYEDCGENSSYEKKKSINYYNDFSKTIPESSNLNVNEIEKEIFDFNQKHEKSSSEKHSKYKSNEKNSIRTNYKNFKALYLDFYKKSRHPSALNKILLIFFFQIFFFLSINLCFILLIRREFIVFENEVNKMNSANFLTNSYSIALLSANIKKLNEEGYISGFNQTNNDLFKQLAENFNNLAADLMKKFYNNLNAIDFENIFKLRLSNLYFVKDRRKIKFNLAMDQFIRVLGSIIFKLNRTNKINFDDYMFLRINYFNIYNVIFIK